MKDSTAKAIRDSFNSPNVADQNFEDANLVDVVNRLARSVFRVGNAITPEAAGNNDAFGGHVESLTEAVMGVASGMKAIADAINSLADSVRETNNNRP